MLFQDIEAKGFCFALKADDAARSLKAQLQTPYAGEKRCDL
jgi:hypothetical protein